jgi:hypothetical protein
MIFKNGFNSASKKVKDRNANNYPRKDEENDDEPE